MSAPARTNETSTSSTARSPSSQPLLAAAISITLPVSEFTPDREVSVAALLKEAGRKISLQFGRGGNSHGIVAFH